MTWAYAEDFTQDRFAPYDYDQRKMYSAIVSTMQNVLPAVGGFVRIIPSGIAIQLARYRMGDILNRDGFHLSYTLGRYTAACTWCEVLTGRIIDGNRYWPAKISADEAAICQQAAHEAVFHATERSLHGFLGYIFHLRANVGLIKNVLSLA